MKQQGILAMTIARLRREHGLTQEQLAVRLNVTAQAVSKWEKCQSIPDTALLPELALALETGIDVLFGYVEQAKQHNPYELQHETDTRYQAFKPSQLAVDILNLYPPVKHTKVLHISCGKGRDTLFLARNGYEVTAFDYSETAVEMCRNLLAEHGQYANVFCADVNEFYPNDDYNIIFSTGVLHYIKPNKRQDLFDSYKQHTLLNGLNLFNAFVGKPFITPAPDIKGYEDFYSGELFSYYRDWYIHKMNELIYDCNSRGVPHKHCLDIIIAEKR
jgi:tellurite methyltransferase